MDIKTEYDDLKVRILEELTSKFPDIQVYIAPARGSGKSNRDLEKLADLMTNGFEIIPLAKLKKGE